MPIKLERFQQKLIVVAIYHIDKLIEFTPERFTSNGRSQHSQSQRSGAYTLAMPYERVCLFCFLALSHAGMVRSYLDCIT